MSRIVSRVEKLEQCGPLFRAYCHIRGLKDGDEWSPLEFLEWRDGMTGEESRKIIKEMERKDDGNQD